MDTWLRGDPAGPPPPPQRSRNRGWRHLSNNDILLMPDTWEYPWYAAWDLAFHCVAMALVDPTFAKDQMPLLLHEWYMHPNGQFYGDDFTVECPTGSGSKLTLGQVAQELTRRLTAIFLRDEQGRRAIFGDNATFQNDAQWRYYIPFYEYFHGESGRGVGASHQTGWTAVVANLLQA